MSTSAAKPRVGGGVYVAPRTAGLPTNATTALAELYQSAGYISEDGVSRDVSKDTTVIKAWGGSVVAVISESQTETFKMTFIEYDNLVALGLTFKEVTGTLATGIKAVTGVADPEPKVFVIESILAGNVLQRWVIPKGVVTDVGTVTLKDNQAQGYEITITAMEDSNGETSYLYMTSGAGA